MSAKKRTPPTSTLSLRIDSEVLTAIKKNAHTRDMSVWDYIISQVDPMSELGQVLQVEQSRVLLREEGVRSAFVEFVTGLTQIKEQNGLDSQGFADAIKQSFESVYKQNTESNDSK